MNTGRIQAVSDSPGQQNGNEQGERQQRREIIERCETQQRGHSPRVDFALRSFVQQADQLRGHQDRKKRYENTGGRVGELASDSTLEDHFLTLVKNCSDNRRFRRNTPVLGRVSGI